MKVIKVIVDELPKTCGYCKFEIPKENVKEAWAVCLAADKEMVYHNCPPPEWCPLSTDKIIIITDEKRGDYYIDNEDLLM